MEIWKDILGYETYQVSNYGRVKSLNYNHTRQTKILKPCKDKYGYLIVVLSKNGKHKTFKVHRLVAGAFLPNLLDYPQINHIDEDKTNNLVENLEWCDGKENINHGTRNKRVSEKLTNGKRSKTVLQITKTGELVKEWPSTNECERNGFYSGAVSACCRGEKPQYKGFIWKYKEK